MGDELVIRAMRSDEWGEVATLIHLSTNYWYEVNRRLRIFACPPEACNWFCKVYETLDPGCCLVACDGGSEGRLVGSCFYHPRPTHVSLGIMNAHPSHAGRGVASRLLGRIVQIAQRAGEAGAAGFLGDEPGLVLAVQPGGICPAAALSGHVPGQRGCGCYAAGVGGAGPRGEDGRCAGNGGSERELAGIDRQKDFEYFIRNEQGIWHTLVLESPAGRLGGFPLQSHHRRHIGQPRLADLPRQRRRRNTRNPLGQEHVLIELPRHEPRPVVQREQSRFIADETSRTGFSCSRATCTIRASNREATPPGRRDWDGHS